MIVLSFTCFQFNKRQMICITILLGHLPSIYHMKAWIHLTHLFYSVNFNGIIILNYFIYIDSNKVIGIMSYWLRLFLLPYTSMPRRTIQRGFSVNLLLCKDCIIIYIFVLQISNDYISKKQFACWYSFEGISLYVLLLFVIS